MAEPRAGGEVLGISSTNEPTGASITRGFLFADLRGYTRFVERRGATAAAGLLVRYRTLVRELVGRHAGAEIKTEGDSFYVVSGPRADALREAVRSYAVDPSHRFETVIGTIGFDVNGDSRQQFVTFYKVEMSAAGGKGDWVVQKQQDYGPAP